MRDHVHRCLALILAGALCGCAAAERRQAADTEKLLAASGFRRIPADGPERQRDLAGLPAREIVLTRREDAKTVYAYADPQNCRCLYIGGPKAYAKYRQFQLSEDIARDMSTAAANSASTNFPVWASWDAQWAPTDAWDDPDPAAPDF